MPWLEFDADRDEVADRFIDLTDGRTLFLPRGRGGPAVLVPDEAARLRVHRIYTWLNRATEVYTRPIVPR